MRDRGLVLGDDVVHLRIERAARPYCGEAIWKGCGVVLMCGHAASADGDEGALRGQGIQGGHDQCGMFLLKVDAHYYGGASERLHTIRLMADPSN